MRQMLWGRREQIADSSDTAICLQLIRLITNSENREKASRCDCADLRWGELAYFAAERGGDAEHEKRIVFRLLL